MITIGRTSNWYRPYSYDKYKIKSIKFYDESGIVVENCSGWLENNKQDLYYINLNVDEIKLKRKEDFSIKGAFIISLGKEPYGDELQADLYIHKDLFNVEFSDYRKEYDSIRKYYKGIDNSSQEFEVVENAKWLKDEYYEYLEKVEEIGKKISSIYGSTTEEEFDNYIKDLKKYGKKLFEEKQRIKDYSVEDYLKEIESECK